MVEGVLRNLLRHAARDAAAPLADLSAEVRATTNSAGTLTRHQNHDGEMGSGLVIS